MSIGMGVLEAGDSARSLARLGDTESRKQRIISVNQHRRMEHSHTDTVLIAAEAAVVHYVNVF